MILASLGIVCLQDTLHPGFLLRSVALPSSPLRSPAGQDGLALFPLDTSRTGAGDRCRLSGYEGPARTVVRPEAAFKAFPEQVVVLAGDHGQRGL